MLPADSSAHGTGGLQELDLGRAPMLTSRPLAALRKGLPQLRHLSLSRAKLRAPDGLAPPAAWGCAPLEQLTLNRCRCTVLGVVRTCSLKLCCRVASLHKDVSGFLCA